MSEFAGFNNIHYVQSKKKERKKGLSGKVQDFFWGGGGGGICLKIRLFSPPWTRIVGPLVCLWKGEILNPTDKEVASNKFFPMDDSFMFFTDRHTYRHTYRQSDS